MPTIEFTTQLRDGLNTKDAQHDEAISVLSQRIGDGRWASITPPALAAGETNNYNPTGLATANIIYQDVNAAGSTLTGLAAQSVGFVITIMNINAAAVLTIAHDSGSSLAANRIYTPGGEDIELDPGQSVRLVKDSNVWRALGTPGGAAAVVERSYLDVTEYGATGDGVTNDTAAIQATVNNAAALGVDVFFPAGTYKTVGYIFLNGITGMKVFGTAGAAIRYSSDDTAIVADAFALTNAHARSAFYLRNCTNVNISNLTFIGGDKQNITTDNIGSAIAARYCVGISVERVTARSGYALFVQDAQPDLSGTGDTLTNTAGTVSLVDAAGLFSAGHVGRRVAISGATNQGNNGSFVVTAYVSATEIRYTNANATTETSSFAWSIDCADRGTRILNCRSESQRGPVAPGNDAAIIGCLFERPVSTLDATGLVDQLEFSGGTVTITDKAARFTPAHHGKIIKIAGAFDVNNNVTAKLTYISSTQVSYPNASGVSDYGWGTTTWWIANGERAGRGNGANAIDVTAGVVTLTSSENAFATTDVGKAIRIASATTAANNGIFLISEYVAANQVKFANASGASEAFSGIWSVDSYDNIVSGGNTYGSTHAIYVFAGRSEVLVQNCTFRGIRTTCVKWSGSSLPLRNLMVRGCTAYECGDFVTGGADDLQDHSGLAVEGNALTDVGTNRPGASSSICISILGARNVSIAKNTLHFTRNATGTVDGRGNAGVFGIAAVGSSGGATQALEDITVEGNNFTVDDTNCSLGNVLNTAVKLTNVGLRARYNTGGTLTKSGSVMTLTEAGAYFQAQDIGKFIHLPTAAGAGNIGAFEVVGVPSSSTIEFWNPAGTGGGVSAGTWRLRGRAGFAGACRVAGNSFSNVAGVNVYATNCVGPEIVDNLMANGGIYIDGCVTPRIEDNRQLCTNTQTAQMRFFNGVSWPIVANNTITNQAIGSVSGWDFQLGDSGGTDYDFPLLGVRGRCVPTEGRPEVVFAYGSGHVDGDTVTVDGNTFTYKASAPGATEFNSAASLIALIEALASYTCADYGAPFTVTTNHIKVRRSTVSSTTDLFAVSVSTLNPTALVLLRNSSAPHTTCNSRGEDGGAGVNDKSVIWSPLADWRAALLFHAENADGATLLQANGYYVIKNSGLDGGCDEVVNHGDAAGTEVFRWAVH